MAGATEYAAFHFKFAFARRRDGENCRAAGLYGFLDSQPGDVKTVLNVERGYVEFYGLALLEANHGGSDLILLHGDINAARLLWRTCTAYGRES